MFRPALVLAAVAVSGPALADCAPFTLTSDSSTRKVRHVDAGQGGLGDLRIGSRLVQLDGKPKGEKHWVGMVLGSGDDAPALFNRVWRLDDGEIHARQMVGIVSEPSDTSRPSIGDGGAVIIGGSGDYQGATGNVTVDLEGTSVTYIFDINCD
ncbi:hypothetical protein [Hoeflea sp.]|uniref:hypothetical protein n=1 Tax=Hoeflea sp. TaxID=1940281 RepID=UPI003B021378